MDNKFISIITCSYNSSQFIKDNINSVNAQTFENYEHIFVDGFSSDGTIEIIKELTKNKKNIKIIQSNPIGTANAMNIGIDNANGEYLLFLNADDFLYSKNSLKNVANFIINNPGHTWYYGVVDTITKDKKYIYSYPHRLYQKKFFYWVLRLTFFMQHPAIFYSKKIFLKYGGYDEKLYAMDYEHAIRIGRKEKAKFMDIKVSNFRLGGISTTQPDIMEEDVKKIYNKYFLFPNFWFFIRKNYIKLSKKII